MSSTSSDTTAHDWTLPSARIQELIRQGAETVLQSQTEWLAKLDKVGLEPGTVLPDDPVLAAATRRLNKAHVVHWATSNIQNPGALVPRYVSADTTRNAREMARRGLSDQMLRVIAREHSAAWELWLQIAFRLTGDPDELKELLEVSARLNSAFLDTIMATVSDVMKAEMEEHARNAQVDRRELVSSILEGRTQHDYRQIGLRLDYSFNQTHCAAVIWSEDPDIEIKRMEKAADILMRHAGPHKALTIIANTATVWVWFNSTMPADVDSLQTAISRLGRVKVALGSIGRGVEGFRRGHLDALATQKLVGQLKVQQRVVLFDQVRLVSLVSQDGEAAQRFIRHTLGDLVNAEASVRDALYTFLVFGCNAAETARQLQTHRNTLLNRIAKAEQFLPRPLASTRVHVAVALELLHWLDNDSSQA